MQKNFNFDTNLKEIHTFKVVKHLSTHFGHFRIFPLLAGGVASRDVIIYKVDCILHYNEQKCYNFDTCFVTRNVQKLFLVRTKTE